MLHRLHLILSSFILLSFAFPLLAAPPVDAGRLLREQPKAPLVLPGNSQQPAVSKPAEQTNENVGAKVLVKGFQINGATLIPVAELQSQIEFSIGKELSILELQSIADLLIAYHAQKGYLVQAILPPQDVEKGIVNINIIEGKRGSIEINNLGKRVDAEKVKGFIEHRLAQGDTMRLSNLGESINILNEQPGVQVKSTLRPGAKESEVDLLVTAADKPLAVFDFSLNNKGSRGTGELQAVAGINLQNPLGLFDLASLVVAKTEGSTFGLGSYSLAVGTSGLRAGVSASRLYYEVTQDSFSALNARGNATTFGLNAQYPLYRLANYSLSLAGNLDSKYLRDKTIAGETGDRKVQSATLGLFGKSEDAFGGGGATDFGVSLVKGHSEEGNQAAIAADKASRNFLGSYGKFKFNLSRLQKLGDSWLLGAKLDGQLAFDNLDSSERFFLGGADGIRAYPTGEAGADEGWLLSINLIRPFTDKLQGTLFVDAGGVRVNKHTWAGWNAGNPNLENRYTLAGVGAAIDWTVSDQVALSASLAAPIGSNAGRDVNGNDSDSRSQDLRGWINIVCQF